MSAPGVESPPRRGLRAWSERFRNRHWWWLHLLAWLLTALALVYVTAARNRGTVPEGEVYNPILAIALAMVLLALPVWMFLAARRMFMHGPSGRSVSLAGLSAIWALLWMIAALGEVAPAGTAYDAISEMVFWTTWDAVPGLKIVETMEWPQPMSSYGTAFGALLVIIRIFVVFGLVRFVFGLATTVLDHTGPARPMAGVPARRHAPDEEPSSGPGQAPSPTPDSLRFREQWWIWLAVILAVIAVVGSIASTNRSVFDLSLGDCVDLENTQEVITDVPIQDCARPHDGEVTLVDPYFFGSFESYPGPEVLEEQAALACEQSLHGARLPDGYQPDWLSLYPTEESWEDVADRGLVCIGLALDAAGQPVQTSGSFFEPPVSG